MRLAHPSPGIIMLSLFPAASEAAVRLTRYPQAGQGKIHSSFIVARLRGLLPVPVPLVPLFEE